MASGKKIAPPLPLKTGRTVRRSQPECGRNMFPETSVGHETPTFNFNVFQCFTVHFSIQ